MISTDITGIILAGGKSSRMLQEKGQVPLLGKPLIEYVIDNLGPYCSNILISANNHAYNHLGYTIVPDQYQDVGPMGGVFSCLEKSNTELNVVVACDMPFFAHKAIQCLLESRRSGLAVIPWHEEDKFEPMSALYLKSFSTILKRYLDDGMFKLPLVFKNENITKLQIKRFPGCFGEQTFLNVNSKAELDRLEKRIQNGDINL